MDKIFQKAFLFFIILTIILVVSFVIMLLSGYFIEQNKRGESNLIIESFKMNLSNFFSIILREILTIFLIINCIFFFYLWSKDKRTELIYLIGLNLSIATFMIPSFFNISILQSIFPDAFYLIIFFFTLHANKSSKVKPDLIMKIFLIGSIICFILNLVIFKSNDLKSSINYYAKFLFAIYNVYIVVYRYLEYFYRKKFDLKKFLLPLSIIFISSLNEILSFLLISYPIPSFIDIGFSLYILIVTFNHIGKFIEDYLSFEKNSQALITDNAKLKEELEREEKIVKNLTSVDTSYKEVSKELFELGVKTKKFIEQFVDKVDVIEEINQEISLKEDRVAKLIELELNLNREMQNAIFENSNNFENINSNISIIKEFSLQINNFAKQTTLLALNASIEASKNSEYAKSFLVVAQEVKNLSVKSSSLVDSIQSIIEDIYRLIDSGLVSSSLLSRYFNEFYETFCQYKSELNKNLKIHSEIISNFAYLTQYLQLIIEFSDRLKNYSSKLIESNRN